MAVPQQPLLIQDQFDNPPGPSGVVPIGVPTQTVTPANLLAPLLPGPSDIIIFDAITCAVVGLVNCATAPTEMVATLSILRRGQAIWAQSLKADLISTITVNFAAYFPFADNFHQPLQINGPDEIRLGISLACNQPQNGLPIMEIAEVGNPVTGITGSAPIVGLFGGGSSAILYRQNA